MLQLQPALAAELMAKTAATTLNEQQSLARFMRECSFPAMYLKNRACWKFQMAISSDTQTYPVRDGLLEEIFVMDVELAGDSTCSHDQINCFDLGSVVNPVGRERTREDSCRDRRSC